MDKKIENETETTICTYLDIYIYVYTYIYIYVCEVDHGLCGGIGSQVRLS